MNKAHNSQLLFIYPKDPRRSFLHECEEFNLDSQEQTLQSIAEAIEKEKQCFLEFTDFFGRPIPKNSTPDYFKALQPFYITKMISKKEVFEEEIKKLQVFVSTLKGQTLTLEACPSDTVGSIKKQIQQRERIPVEQQRLDFEGKTIQDDDTLSDCNILSKSTLSLKLRLSGGVSGKEFVDLTQEMKAEILEWSDKAPQWRRAQPGLSFEGKCGNQKCKAFGNWVIINKGMTTYDQVYDDYTNLCPMCSNYVSVEKCAFNNCRYGYSGIKLRTGLPAQKVTSQKEIQVGNHYKLFDPEVAGSAIWTTLKIVTKKIDSRAISKGATCGICQNEVNRGVKKLDCSHLFHDECYIQMQSLPLSIHCSHCHF